MAAPTYATRDYKIQAGGSIQIARMSDFLTALEASAPFKVSFDNQPRTDFEAGLTYNTENGFQLVEIINEHETELTVKLGFGRGDIKDSRLTLGAATINTRESVPNKIEFGRKTFYSNETLVIQPDANRYEILIRRVDSGDAILSLAAFDDPYELGYGQFYLKNDETITFKSSSGFKLRSFYGEASIQLIMIRWA